MNDNLYGSICLSDIPKELIQTGKNGKKYLNVEVRARQNTDNYGNTHYIKVAVRKSDLPEGANPYIGSLKPSKFGVEPAQPAERSAEIFPPKHDDPLAAQVREFISDVEQEDGLPF